MNDLLSKVFDAHCAEADKKGAEFSNLGWGQGEDFIESKTSEGILISRSENGEITHQWLTYAEVYPELRTA